MNDIDAGQGAKNTYLLFCGHRLFLGNQDIRAIIRISGVYGSGVVEFAGFPVSVNHSE